jgi:DNA-binding cell septation regulator SpoVG
MSQLIANVTKLQNPKNNVTAVATVLVAGFAINDIRVIHKPGEKPWAAMPSRKSAKSTTGFKDIAHPTDRSSHEALQTAVIEKYNSLA